MENRFQNVCLGILATVAVGAALYLLRGVMIPFVLAVFVALGLRPIVAFLVRYVRLPQPIALLVALLCGGFAFLLVSGLVSASVRELATNAPVYNEHLNALLDRALAALPGDLAMNREDAIKNIPAKAVGGALASTTNAVLGILSQSVLVLFFVVFLMLGGRGDGESRATGVWSEAETRVQRYIVTKIAISSATGLLVGLTLSLLGVPLAMAFGLFAFLLNFIPSIGSILATLLPLPVVVVDPTISSTAATLAIVIPASIQVVVGNMLEPKIMGDTMDLHPVVILLSLILWGTLWGIVGMLLAVPITATLKILLDRSERSRPFAELMAGRIDGLDDTADPGTSAEVS